MPDIDAFVVSTVTVQDPEFLRPKMYVGWSKALKEKRAGFADFKYYQAGSNNPDSTQPDLDFNQPPFVRLQRIYATAVIDEGALESLASAYPFTEPEGPTGVQTASITTWDFGAIINTNAAGVVGCKYDFTWVITEEVIATYFLFDEDHPEEGGRWLPTDLSPNLAQLARSYFDDPDSIDPRVSVELVGNHELLFSSLTFNAQMSMRGEQRYTFIPTGDDPFDPNSTEAPDISAQEYYRIFAAERND